MRKPDIRKFVLSLTMVLFAAPLWFSQVPPELKPAGKGGSAELVTLRLSSPLMGREMPYRVMVPRDYKTRSDTRYPVVYLLHGLTGHYNNWTDKTRVAEYAFPHNFIIVTPEGGNGWYTDSVSLQNDKYESYIVKELIPEIDKRYRTVADRNNRFIAGLSMGGYGAVKFGLKFPELFSLVGSFSGALGATAYDEANAGAIGKSMLPIFGPADSESRRSNDIFAMIRGLDAERIKRLPFLYLSCGTEDFLFQDNRNFAALLVEKKVPHEYRQHPGGHTWDFWDTHVREFLDLASRRGGKAL